MRVCVCNDVWTVLHFNRREIFTFPIFKKYIATWANEEWVEVQVKQDSTTDKYLNWGMDMQQDSL